MRFRQQRGATVAACNVAMTTSGKTESFVASHQVFQSVVILGPYNIVKIAHVVLFQVV